MNRLRFYRWRILGHPTNVKLYRRALAGDNGISRGFLTPELQADWDKRFAWTCWGQMTETEQSYCRWLGLQGAEQP